MPHGNAYFFYIKMNVKIIWISRTYKTAEYFCFCLEGILQEALLAFTVSHGKAA